MKQPNVRETHAQAYQSNIGRGQGSVLAGGNNAVAENDDNADELSIILFEVGDSQFALPTRGVTEVVRVSEIVQIPRAPHFIEGVIEIRNQVIPVIDLRKKLGLGTQEQTSWTIIVAIIRAKRMGFIVDLAKKVLALTLDELQDLGSVVSGNEGKYIYRTVNRDGQPIVILNIDTLLNDEEMSQLNTVVEAIP